MTDTLLPGIRLVLGLTGGVAAYKAAELARLLMHAGADVQAVMTRSASKFVGTATLQALTGKPVLTELWDEAFPIAWRISTSRVLQTRFWSRPQVPILLPSSRMVLPMTCSLLCALHETAAPGCTGDEQANVGKRRNSTQYRYTEA